MKDLDELSKKLGTLHREVWEYHDLQAFENLAKSVQKLLVGLGFEPRLATGAAEHIKHAYSCADKAAAAMKTTDTALEQMMYKEAAAHLKQARTLLHLDSAGGMYEAKWWHAFRHQDGVEVGRLLYEELYINTSDPEFALLGAYLIFTAGRAHSERDWRKVETLLQQYWKHVLDRKYCFLAGGL